MRTDPSSSTRIDRLIGYLFDGATSDLLAAEVRASATVSPRFRAFAEEHRDKIRKKLRGATEAESRGDVRAELRVAHALLTDRRVGLAFEAYRSRRAGPDFTVTFREHVAFNLEVTRPRRPPDVAALASALLVKLRQLPPSTPNALLVATAEPDVTAEQVALAVRELRRRADARDEPLFRAGRFAGPRAFYDRFMRLGAVIAWWEPAGAGNEVSAWTNPSARIVVPPQALRAVLRCLAAANR